MTPKRMEAMVFIAQKRRARERAEFVMDAAASRGEAKGIDQYLKGLLK